ncbi:MAG: MerR family transcriptional regulator [Eubacteriales bacterium]|nr:MerR family transcriptional regulator [Eubacteriales bacterium]
MKTVKEVSKLTGISVRTLHWYDEIGLLRPTATSEAGYRLYDDKALETLQQILFFREFDMPLKEIKAVMDSPDFDQEQILKSQKRMLELKRDRLNRLISSIDDILKGENKMDFAVFDKSEIEAMYQGMIANMDAQTIRTLEEQYGSMEAYQKHFLENMQDPKVQENLKKVVEWYGDKEQALEASVNPENPKLLAAYQNRMQAIYEKLAAKRGEDAGSFAVKQLIGEMDFASKQAWQMKDVEAMMLEMADLYLENEKAAAGMDAQYGEGTAAFLGKAIREFYKH